MSQDVLIKNCRLLSSATAPIQEKASILIRDGRIQQTGNVIARAETTINADGALVIPGLIDCQAHLAQTLCRNLAPRLNQPAAFAGELLEQEYSLDASAVRLAAQLACVELIRTGVTAFLSTEMTPHLATILEVVAESGLYGVVGRGFMDEAHGLPVPAMDYEELQAECEVLLHRWQSHARVQIALAPWSPLHCTLRAWAALRDFARDNGLRLVCRYLDTPAMRPQLQEKTGLAPMDFLQKTGWLGADVALVHSVHATAAEIPILAQSGTCVMHCPATDLLLGGGVSRISEMYPAKVALALGSDGTAVSPRMDIFENMHLASLIQKPLYGPKALTDAQVLDMATAQGADALGLGKHMGRIAPGCRANLVLLNCEAKQLPPTGVDATMVVHEFAAADVLMTMVDGRILYEEGRVTTLDEPALIKNFRARR